ncbi:hypothetical protein AQJ30_23945 [Streptomyces longwoodensis]|uniref:Uncharacterized protein n=1 Tax=Streptomyces longwoodensis TaxID=68231 RepID=A0A101QTD7_9ACTN|nr:hypothetical protein AQJ30_23945 [Streptomyces longwoodensis]
MPSFGELADDPGEGLLFVFGHIDKIIFVEACGAPWKLKEISEVGQPGRRFDELVGALQLQPCHRFDQTLICFKRVIECLLMPSFGTLPLLCCPLSAPGVTTGFVFVDGGQPPGRAVAVVAGAFELVCCGQHLDARRVLACLPCVMQLCPSSCFG